MAGKMFIVLGLGLVAVGVLLSVWPNAFAWFGHLPGDIRIENESSRFYFPITSMLIISVLLSLLHAFLSR